MEYDRVVKDPNHEEERVPNEVRLQDMPIYFQTRLLVVDAAAVCYTTQRNGDSKGMARQLKRFVVDFLRAHKECKVCIVWDAVWKDFEKKLAAKNRFLERRRKEGKPEAEDEQAMKEWNSVEQKKKRLLLIDDAEKFLRDELDSEGAGLSGRVYHEHAEARAKPQCLCHAERPALCVAACAALSHFSFALAGWSRGRDPRR